MSLSDATMALIEAAFTARDQAAKSANDSRAAAAAVVSAQQAADRASTLAETDAQQAADTKAAAVSAVEQELSTPPSMPTVKKLPSSMPSAARSK